MSERTPHRVALVAYDRLCMFEFGMALEIFGLPRPDLREPWYALQVCTLERGGVRGLGGVQIRAGAGLRALREAQTIVIPGWRDPGELPPAGLLRALREAHGRGARIMSICSGAFALAAAGLLDGRRATTHWMYAEQLAQRYPRVQVDPNVLFVDEGSVLTSAGSAAGVDLCLHVVGLDFGAEVASQVARRLVLPPQRQGGQAQYVPAQGAPPRAGEMAELLEWIQRSLDQPLSVAGLARRAAMSPRTLARRFEEELGTTPHRWVTHQRVLAARRLLETSDDPVDVIAAAVGLGTAVNLRHHFTRALGVSPSAYRRQFGMRAVS